MYLLTHTGRKSGLGSISLVIGCNAASIAKQTKADIERVFSKSNAAAIAYGNGAEFSSWPCRLRKHWLIRDFYPKGTDFKKLTALMYIRPRKSIEQQTQKASRRLNPA